MRVCLNHVSVNVREEVGVKPDSDTTEEDSTVVAMLVPTCFNLFQMNRA